MNLIPFYCNVFDMFNNISEDNQTGKKLSNFEVTETEKGICLSIEMPGYDKGKISILREGKVLQISAEDERKGKKRSFSKSFILPNDIDLENIEADYKDGILDISLSRKPETKPRRIEIR